VVFVRSEVVAVLGTPGSKMSSERLRWTACKSLELNALAGLSGADEQAL